MKGSVLQSALAKKAQTPASFWPMDRRLKMEDSEMEKSDHKPCRGGQDEEDLWSAFCEKVDGGPVIEGRGGGVEQEENSSISQCVQRPFSRLGIIKNRFFWALFWPWGM
jgi:hypothetical protein